MTLAIAAEYPWGEHRRSVESLPGAHVESSIILAADTRWTYEDGTCRDDGRKLWVIGPQVGVLIAGDVWAGEECVHALGKSYRHDKIRHARDVVRIATEVFAKTYQAHHLQRQSLGDVYILAAMVDKKGDTLLVRFSNKGAFEPIYLKGLHAIGTGDACDAARDQLNALTEREGFVADAPIPWALRIVGVIDDLVQDAGYPSVGGLVQWLVGTKDGWESHGSSVLKPGRDFENDDSWRQTGANFQDLRSMGSFGGKWLAATEASELEVVRIAP